MTFMLYTLLDVLISVELWYHKNSHPEEPSTLQVKATDSPRNIVSESELTLTEAWGLFANMTKKEGTHNLFYMKCYADIKKNKSSR